MIASFLEKGLSASHVSLKVALKFLMVVWLGFGVGGGAEFH